MDKNIKINFISNTSELSYGSYRIWIDNLNYYFNKLNIQSTINSKNSKDYDIHIYNKGNYNILNKNKINGIINPSSDHNKLKDFDFAIVGSIEEKESIIGIIKYVFIFPLIEKLYLNIQPKIHKYEEKIIIGYHGNQNHLNHFNLGLKKALEKINENFNIELNYICQNNKEWIEGIPNIKKNFIKWNIKNIKEEILKFDIGIIPNISEIYNEKKLEQNITLGKYNTDIKIRFKNKSNNGRLLVLAQCGIPIIADITPSNMHILGNPDNGFAVLNKNGWYDALYQLCSDHDLRNIVSQNAYNEVKRLYDPFKLATNLYNNIKKIKKN